MRRRGRGRFHRGRRGRRSFGRKRMRSGRRGLKIGFRM